MPRARGNNRFFRPGRGRGRGAHRGGGHGTLVFEGDFEDFTLEHMIPPSQRRGRRARGGSQTPPRGEFQHRGGGRAPKAMRGIGFALSQPRIPLSTLERDRPLLRPVEFVRGVHQKTLFEEVEEILHAPGEEGGAIEDHAPSADVVERLFNQDAMEGAVTDLGGSDSSSVSDSEQDRQIGAVLDISGAVEQSVSMFMVDTEPSPIVLDRGPAESVVGTSVTGATPLGDSGDDDIIVYVAPHPRTGRSTPAVSLPAPSPFKPPPQFPGPTAQHEHTASPGPSAPSLNSISLNLTPSSDPDKILAAQVEARKKAGLKPTPRSRKMAKKERAAARRREERRALFGSASFGLTVEEQRALENGTASHHDPREAERRRGDSDVDWGSDDVGGIEELRSGIGDMDLDGDSGDVAALARFARGVEGLGAGEVVTIADLEDAARMREEDEQRNTDGEGSSGGDDDVFDAEERRQIGEESPADSSESSDEESPEGGFQARLNRLRGKARGTAVVVADSSSDEEEGGEGGVFGLGFSWADRDESYLRKMEKLLDENGNILHGRDRKARNKLFKAVQNGNFEDDYDDLALNMTKKDRQIPPELRDQWQRDRTKKAEHKRIRELARLQAAADSYPTHKKKQKLFLAARLVGDTLFADHVSDMALLEQQIRTFIGDLELKTMVLPPRGKEWRRHVHVLAEAFNLKSKSKGKGDGRYTTLMKTTRSGVGANERKIARLVNGNRGEGFQPSTKFGKTVRTRDGDVVGKMAPKLSETNMGFRLLQQMGWEEGDRIGVTGGLVDPLTAIIKTTKLGLGATR